MMTQNTKIFIALVSGFAIGYSISKLMDNTSKTIEKEKEKPTPKKSPKPTFEPDLKVVKDVEFKPINKSSDDEFPLQLGSEGERVKRLQIFLMRNLGWIRQPKGKFDLLTQNRTVKFFKVESISQELYSKFMLDKMVHDQRLKKAK
jgi:hypothetical protein